MKRLHTIVTILMLFPVILYAQQNAHFISLNQSNGLKSGDVMCFQQDDLGFIWIGTKYGLNVYDGSNFNVYGFTDEIASGSDISSLQKGHGNDMWIGTLGDGLFLFKGKSREIVPVLLQDGTDTILNVNCLISWNDSIWAGTDRGLFSIGMDGRMNSMNGRDSKNNITALGVHNKMLVVGIRNVGLYMFSAYGDSTYVGFREEQVNAIRSFDRNEMLVGTQSSGLYIVRTGNGNEITKYSLGPFGENPKINKMILDGQNNVWIGTDGYGLVKMVKNRKDYEIIQRYTYDGTVKNSIPSNAIFSLFEDQFGNIWIGTIWKGLSVLKSSPSNTIFYYSDLTGDEPFPVLSIFRENDELWLGTDGKGLNIINTANKTVETLSTRTWPSISGDYVQKIFKDSRGIYWMGTFSSGLTEWNRNTGLIREFKHSRIDSTTISYNDIREILEDHEHNLWIATWGGGLNRYVPGEDIFRSFSGTGGGSLNLTDNMTSIRFNSDSSGLWAGTFGNGLFYFDLAREEFEKILHAELRNLKILSMYLDNENLLWIGTWGSGIRIFDVKSMTIVDFNSLDQISSSRITSIIEDDEGNMWISSKNGIYEYQRKDSTLLKHGGFDLITNREFHINSSFRDSEGKIYFGGIEGVIAITPSVETRDETIEPPAITSIQLYNDRLPSAYAEKAFRDKKLRLAFNQNYFTFNFASPYFPVSDIIYSFKMEGLNEEWINTLNDFATFTNLNPGKYTFAVRSSINSIDWSTPERLEIFIRQPLWKRWYAYVVYVSIFTLLLYLFQKYTREWEAMKSNLKLETLTRDKENELHNIKQRFFTNISHEIKTPVSLILGATSRLNESGILNKEYSKELDSIRNSSRHLLHLINELLDFRRLEAEGIKLRVAEGDFLKFAREIYLSFQTQASQKNIDFRFNSGGESIHLWFDRDQMEKVLYNLISNAFKYTPPGGQVSIELDQDDQFCYFKVVDSGKGISEEQLSEIFKRFYQSENAAEIRESGFGLGLSIAKDIVQLHGGEIGAVNNPESGISISVKIPKGNHQFPVEQRLLNFKSSENIDSYISQDGQLAEMIDFKRFGELLILIVEDNLHLREHLKGLFARDMKVITAGDGEVGLDLARTRLPDIIISDVMMPVLDGVSMTRALKSDVQTSHIPVVLLTARTNLIYKKEGFEVGADDYITKPFNESLLKTRIFNILLNRKQLREKILKEYITRPREELNISTPDQQFLKDLTAVMENYIHEKEINAKFLTRELGMSHSVIYKKIKALTGLSLIEFVRDFKLKRAAVLLSKYGMNITDVCYKVGFSDRRYFSKLFKQKYGIPPSEYVKVKDKNRT